MPPRSMKMPNGAMRANAAGDLLADLQAAEQLVALLAALLVEGDLLRQDQAVGLAVDLEDLEPELAADVRLELLGDLLRGVARLLVLRPAREVHDLGDRHEAADPAVDDEAALVVVDDRGVDDRARLEQLLHRAPLALEAGAAEREDDVALGRLRLEDVHEDDVADGELRLRLGVAAVELAVADHALGLGADVDEDLVLVDADDGAFDHVTVLEALDVRVLLREQLLHRGRLGAGARAAMPAPRPRARCRRQAARRLPRPRRRALTALRDVGRAGSPGPRRRRRGSPAASVGGAASATLPRRRLRPRSAAAIGLVVGAARLGAGLGGGGLVGDGDGRDGLLGRRGIARLWPPAPARSRPAARRSR